MNYENMQSGHRYRVRWKQEAGNYRTYVKEAVWTFVLYQHSNDILFFSGRPICGTQDMRRESFLSAEEVSKHTPCTVPRTVGEFKFKSIK
jgi:hypothetical protein